MGTPRDPERRGGHVALEHPEAERISAALRGRGVAVDYRPPNVIRLCPAQLYVGFEDVFDVVAEVRVILEVGGYERYGTDGRRRDLTARAR